MLSRLPPLLPAGAAEIARGVGVVTGEPAERGARASAGELRMNRRDMEDQPAAPVSSASCRDRTQCRCGAARPRW